MIYLIVPVVILALSGFLMGRYQIGPIGSGIRSSWPWFLTQALAINAIVVLGGALGKLLGFGSISYDMRKVVLYLGVFLIGMLFQVVIAITVNRYAKFGGKEEDATKKILTM